MLIFKSLVPLIFGMMMHEVEASNVDFWHSKRAISFFSSAMSVSAFILIETLPASEGIVYGFSLVVCILLDIFCLAHFLNKNSENVLKIKCFNIFLSIFIWYLSIFWGLVITTHHCLPVIFCFILCFSCVVRYVSFILLAMMGHLNASLIV